jgi:hypothetical protein
LCFCCGFQWKFLCMQYEMLVYLKTVTWHAYIYIYLIYGSGQHPVEPESCMVPTLRNSASTWEEQSKSCPFQVVGMTDFMSFVFLPVWLLWRHRKCRLFWSPASIIDALLHATLMALAIHVLGSTYLIKWVKLINLNLLISR